MSLYIFHFHIYLSLGFLHSFSFHFQVLNGFIHFPPLFVCVFIDFFMGFIYFLLKDFCHIHKGYLRYFSYISDMLQFSGPTVVGLLGSNGDILLSVLLIVH